MKSGYVYILKNPGLKDGWFKFFFSTKAPHLIDLSVSEMKEPFCIDKFIESKHAEEIFETILMIHVGEKRTTSGGIYMNFDSDLMYQILQRFKNIAKETTVVKEEKPEKPKPPREDKNGFSFTKAGILPGETIVFIEDPKVRPVVNGDKTVKFEGRTWYLSPLVRELMTRLGKVSQSGAYRGALFFTYKGEILLDLI